MSMISEQIKRLKNIKEELETNGELDCDISSLQDTWAKEIGNAIDTIEALSEKVRANNLHNGWIPCSKGLPEDCEEYSNKKIIDVLVTTSQGKVTKVQRIHNTYNKDYWYWGRILGEMKAWMPLPKGYKDSEQDY